MRALTPISTEGGIAFGYTYGKELAGPVKWERAAAADRALLAAHWAACARPQNCHTDRGDQSPMNAKKGIPAKLQPWFEARRRFKLSNAHIQMARELGMNPKKFGSLANEHQAPWKLPLPEFIVECYRKRFGRSEPAQVRSLEEKIKADKQRRIKRAAKVRENDQQQSGNSQSDGQDHTQ
jgi:hypothetical protein